MIIHQKNNYLFCFGQKSDYQESIKLEQFSDYCHTFCTEYSFDSLTLLQQTHGVNGYQITYEQTGASPLHLFEQPGDFLTTDKKNTALAVATADCLPIIFYDSDNNAIALAHAGWRGSTQNIVEHVLQKMIAVYNTQHENLKLFFGPNAGPCCYKVEENFRDNLAHFRLEEEELALIMPRSNEQYYFDNAQLNIHLLKQLGIKEQQISSLYNHCTIHNKEYHSYRRDGGKAGRQLTIVCLKK